MIRNPRTAKEKFLNDFSTQLQLSKDPFQLIQDMKHILKKTPASAQKTKDLA